MKQVIVNPENCVGCMQCMLACATAHSVSKTLFAATLENPRPRSRIHVAAGRFNQGFPNRCRHCDPAPCQSACLTGAISKIQTPAPPALTRTNASTALPAQWPAPTECCASMKIQWHLQARWLRSNVTTVMPGGWMDKSRPVLKCARQEPSSIQSSTTQWRRKTVQWHTQ